MSNVLVDDYNREHAERKARAAAVAGARSPEEAYRLGAAHAAAEKAGSANVRAYARGLMGEPLTPARKASPAPSAAKAPAVVAKSASAPGVTKADLARGRAYAATAVATSAPAKPLGDIALRAMKYQAEQLAKGNRITTAEAVAHVSTNI